MADGSHGLFLFLDLPTELRIAIYRYALISSSPINLQLKLPDIQPGLEVERNPGATSVSNVESKDETTPVCHALNLAVLRLNKAIYNESRSVLYGENTFITSIQRANKSLNLVLPSKRFILHVEIRVSNIADLLEGFMRLETDTLRYFSNLRTLRILIPETPIKTDWTLGGGDYLFDRTSHGSKWAQEFLMLRLRMLPRKAEIEFTGVGKSLVDSNKIDRYATKLYDSYEALHKASNHTNLAQ